MFRPMSLATASMKAGKWEKKKFQGMELYNRTLAVVGRGTIGRIVALRGKALGMKVIAYDPFTTLERARKLDIELVADFDEVLARADAITVHVPKTKATVGLLNREAFAKARKGLLVINAARGGIVDEEARAPALTRLDRVARRHPRAQRDVGAVRERAQLAQIAGEEERGDGEVLVVPARK